MKDVICGNDLYNEIQPSKSWKTKLEMLKRSVHCIWTMADQILVVSLYHTIKVLDRNTGRIFIEKEVAAITASCNTSHAL